MNTVKIVGIGPGHKDYILPIAYQAVASADFLIGAQRHLELFSDYQKETYCYTERLEELVHQIEMQRTTKKIVVLVSGDPGFYSLLDFIQSKLSIDALEVIPGISSFQYFFSKLKRSYKTYRLLSLHGREVDLHHYLQQDQGVFLLTDRQHTPSKIAGELVAMGYKDWQMAVGENLSYQDERIETGSVQDFIQKEFSNLCVVVINHELG